MMNLVTTFLTLGLTGSDHHIKQDGTMDNVFKKQRKGVIAYLFLAPDVFFFSKDLFVRVTERKKGRDSDRGLLFARSFSNLGLPHK